MEKTLLKLCRKTSIITYKPSTAYPHIKVKADKCRRRFKGVVKIVGWETVELVEKVCKHLSRRKKKVKW